MASAGSTYTIELWPRISAGSTATRMNEVSSSAAATASTGSLALEPRVARLHGAHGRVAHRHLETAAQQAPDASAAMAVSRSDRAPLEVHAIAAQEPRGGGIEIRRVLEEHVAFRCGRGLAHQLEAQQARPLAARDRSRPRDRRVPGGGRRGGAPLRTHLAVGQIEHARYGAAGRRIARAGSERVLDETKRVRHREPSVGSVSVATLYES